MEVLARRAAADAPRCSRAIDADAYNALQPARRRRDGGAGWRRTSRRRHAPHAARRRVCTCSPTSTSTIRRCPKIARSHDRFAAAGDAFAADGDVARVPRRARARSSPITRRRSTRGCPTPSAPSASTPTPSARAARRCSCSTTPGRWRALVRRRCAVHARAYAPRSCPDDVAAAAPGQPAARSGVEPDVGAPRRQERVDRVAVHARRCGSRSVIGW